MGWLRAERATGDSIVKPKSASFALPVPCELFPHSPQPLRILDRTVEIMRRFVALELALRSRGGGFRQQR